MFLKGSQLTKVAWGTLAVAALFSVPTYLTGDPAEDAVRGLPGVSRAVIAPHEQMATLSFIAILVLGVAALAGLLLFARRDQVPVWFLGSTLVLSVVVSGMMAWTAYLGARYATPRYVPENRSPQPMRKALYRLPEKKRSQRSKFHQAIL